jgi:hypothetical protein
MFTTTLLVRHRTRHVIYLFAVYILICSSLNITAIFWLFIAVCLSHSRMSLIYLFPLLFCTIWRFHTWCLPARVNGRTSPPVFSWLATPLSYFLSFLVDRLHLLSMCLLYTSDALLFIYFCIDSIFRSSVYVPVISGWRVPCAGVLAFVFVCAWLTHSLCCPLS